MYNRLKGVRLRTFHLQLSGFDIAELRKKYLQLFEKAGRRRQSGEVLSQGHV